MKKLLLILSGCFMLATYVQAATLEINKFGNSDAKVYDNANEIKKVSSTIFIKYSWGSNNSCLGTVIKFNNQAGILTPRRCIQIFPQNIIDKSSWQHNFKFKQGIPHEEASFFNYLHSSPGEAISHIVTADNADLAILILSPHAVSLLEGGKYETNMQAPTLNNVPSIYLQPLFIYANNAHDTNLSIIYYGDAWAFVPVELSLLDSSGVLLTATNLSHDVHQLAHKIHLSDGFIDTTHEYKNLGAAVYLDSADLGASIFTTENKATNKQPLELVGVVTSSMSHTKEKYISGKKHFNGLVMERVDMATAIHAIQYCNSSNQPYCRFPSFY